MRLLVLEACQSPQSIPSERKKASTDIDSFQPSSNVNKPLMLTSALPLSCAFIIYYLYNQMNKIRIQNKDYCDTLTASMGTGGGNVPIYQKELRIRKLTPLEVWRLMGFDDEDVDKASQVNSNTQLYKQAGNSIVVNVLEAIFKNLII